MHNQLQVSNAGYGSRASANFHSKVFSLFGLALLVTGVGVYTGFHYVMPFFIGAPWLMFVIFALELALIFTSRWWSRKEPLNYVLFSTFTFLSGLTLVPVLALTASEFGGYSLIYNALFATVATFVSAGLIGMTIKKDLSGFYGFLGVTLIGMLVVGIAGIFFPWGNTMEMIYSGIGIVLFTGYAIVDMNRIANNAHDDAVQAAIEIYLDIFNIFLYILRLMRSLSRD